MNRIRLVSVVSLLAVCLSGWAGCGERVSEEDLGTVVEGIPQVPGAEKPYELPDLSSPESKDTGSDENPAAVSAPQLQIDQQ